MTLEKQEKLIKLGRFVRTQPDTKEPYHVSDRKYEWNRQGILVKA